METLRALILLPPGYLFLWPLVDRTLRHPHPGGEANASPLQIARCTREAECTSCASCVPTCPL